VAKKRAGKFSLGMGQRLGIATALLGDPQTVMLDEPVNGLDPEGVLWIRNLMKHLASQGKTVLVSSHLMNEMAVTADHLVVIGRGRLLVAAPTAEVVARGSGQSVRVRTPDADRLTALITDAGGKVIAGSNGGPAGDADETPVLTVTGLPAARIGQLAASAAIELHELTPQLATLEDAFLELTSDSLEFGHRNADVPVQAIDGSVR
jgi:ABC-2 type transport system ATP-binding protein